jgi:transaldolase
MQFFLDTVDLKEIRELVQTGLVDGITTNPSLAAASGVPFREILSEICSLVSGPISVEVTSLEAEEMVKQGRQIASIAENIAVKVPLTFEGLKACSLLAAEDIMVNVTLCFSPAQALLAAKAGASFVSPFLGRLDDISHTGMDLIAEIVDIYQTYGFETEVLAASIRHPLHVVEAAKVGADIATMPPKVFRQLYNHPLTDIGLQNFMKDWQKSGQIL